jgi:peptidoglycan/xylan/chitin deacetylase (PgdA/CDA1 family)
VRQLFATAPAAAVLSALLAMATAGAVPAPQATAAPQPARPLLVTVDDLPVAGSAARGDFASRVSATNALLAALKTHGIHAVAFVIADGVRTDGDRLILQRWLDEGHELGSHTNTHANLTEKTSEAYLADMREAKSPRAAEPATGRSSTVTRSGRAGCGAAVA